MSLRILDDLVQGTDEWHDQRRGMVTASVVGKLITPTLKVADNEVSRGLTATLAAERITGRTEESYVNADMMRGVMAEPFARDIYSGHYQQAVECGFMVREEDGWKLGASPDGLVGDEGGVEIKAPRAKGHVLTILADAVPPQYVAQCQASLLVSGRAWWDFVSYHAGLPLFVKRIYPDEQWFDAIRSACIAFELNAQALIGTFGARAADLPQTERIDFDLEVI